MDNTMAKEVIENKLELLKNEQITPEYTKGFMEGLWATDTIDISQYRNVFKKIEQIREEREYIEIKKDIESEELD